MRAVVLRGETLGVEDVTDPEPGPGQVLLETIACGICGSDLHCARHARQFTDTARATGMTIFDFDPDRPLVMGHEFSGRLVGVGPDVDLDALGVGIGDAVVAHPVVRTPEGMRSVGYSNAHPGGYAERLVVDASGVVPIPEGCDPVHAALTEPLAVGLHAVNATSAERRGSAIVIGCGPVGLAVVAALRLRGVPLVVAADFSPTRRRLAAELGAHVVVDPADGDAVTAWRDHGGRGPAVLVEAVGVPGMIDRLIRTAPRRSEITVAGVCMETDRFEPLIAISKELTVRFVLGWSPAEFAASLAGIADRTIDVAPLITGSVDLDGTPGAFATLDRPDEHAKILVRPNGA